MTWAFRDATLAVSGNQAYVLPDLLIEAGDDVDLSSKALWFRDNSKTYTYTQTGGLFSVGTAAGDRGFLIGVNTNVPVTLNYTLSGGRFETSQLHSWINGSTLTLNVSGDGVLALANGLGNDANNTGAFSTSGANSRLLVTFTEGGTLEPTSGGLGQRGEGTKTITFNGGAIRFGSDTPTTVDMTLPVTFAGTADAPTTIDPGKFGTLVLDAANTAEPTAVLAVPRGTLALADASGLGGATVTVADGAAFEARGFTGEGEGSEEARTVPVVAIKLDIPAGVGNSDGTAIQEFCLYQGDEKVDWPDGTTISGTGGQMRRRPGRGRTRRAAPPGRIRATPESTSGIPSTTQRGRPPPPSRLATASSSIPTPSGAPTCKTASPPPGRSASATRATPRTAGRCSTRRPARPVPPRTPSPRSSPSLFGRKVVRRRSMT